MGEKTNALKATAAALKPLTTRAVLPEKDPLVIVGTPEGKKSAGRSPTDHSRLLTARCAESQIFAFF
jgi:hypothetical protein